MSWREGSLHVLSWKVAGLEEKDINSFCGHVSDAHHVSPGGLQTHSEGLTPEGGTDPDNKTSNTPTLLPPDNMEDFITRAIVVTSQWSKMSSLVGSSSRWVAVKFHTECYWSQNISHTAG